MLAHARRKFDEALSFRPVEATDILATSPGFTMSLNNLEEYIQA
jgi:hypothetical protein